MNALLEHQGEVAHAHEGGHHHLSGRAERSRKRLLMVLALTSAYLLAEAVGGWWTNSLALLADAGHMLTDVAALVLALMAVWFGARPATPHKTFGYHRLEILAALTNGVALVLIALLIFYQAYERLSAPREVESNAMIVVATGGLFVNLVCAWLLHGD
ncbi:MAG TPA: cation diffusion facilitator family transporter, partial [Pyrinomonadaceae bacterium]|nr:cation diffusion facilitator family transporter [Pyrinomonadaceae bacterium]